MLGDQTPGGWLIARLVGEITDHITEPRVRGFH